MSRDKDKAAKWREHLARISEDFPLPGEKRSAELEAWLKTKDEETQKRRAEAIVANAEELDAKSLAFPAVTSPTVILNKAQPTATLIVRPWIRGKEVDYRTWVAAAPSSAGRPAQRGGWKETTHKRTFDLFGGPLSLTVAGLGAHQGRKKRKGAVDLMVMGFRGELSETGATCDGRMGLPDIATHVRLRLNNLKAEVVVGTELGWAPIPAEWLRVTPYVEPKERDSFA